MYYLSFRLAHQWYGTHVDNVIEVMQMVYLSKVPAASPDVLGVMSMREMVVPVIDLRIRFGLPDPVLDLSTPIIGIRTSHGAIGLVVDDVDDVHLIADDMLQVDHESSYVTHIATLNDRLIMLLDVKQLHHEQAQS